MERDFDPSALAFPLHGAQRFEGAARSSLHRLKAALLDPASRPERGRNAARDRSHTRKCLKSPPPSS